MNELPKGWSSTTLSAVTLPYETIDPRRFPEEEFVYIDIGSINNQTHTIVHPKTFFGRDAPSRARRVVASGDVLFSTVRTYLKNIAIVPESFDGQLTSTGIAILRSSGAIEGRYLFFFVRSDAFIAEISKAQDGTLYPAVTDKNVGSAVLPLPPLAEQKRVIAKIENLTYRTGRARTELAHVPALIAKYRSAVFELAFSGKLTADYRKKSKYGEHGLPDSWSVRPLGDISDIQGGVQVGKRRNADVELIEVPYLRVANVQRGWLDLSEVKTISVTSDERDRLLLKSGDVLMNEGGDRDKLGRGWVWGGQIEECIHQNHVFRIRLIENILPPEFLSHFANERGQSYFFDQGTQTTNLASISKRKITALPVPVPPLDEALEIVRRIESAFAWLDRVSADQAAAYKLLPKLDSAILAKAFRGELVAQDPNDEPAAELLDRIDAQRAEQVPTRLKRAPRPPKAEGDSMMSDRSLEQVLTEASDWVPAQTAFQRCGVADGTPTEEIERLYAQLRELDTAGRLEAEAVTDHSGRKLYDRIRLRTA